MRVIVGHTKKRSIAADVLDKLQPVDNLARIRTGCANKRGTRFFTASTAATANVLYSSQSRL
jgi:hypothetical protein